MRHLPIAVLIVLSLYSTPSQITYAGMSIECNYGCGDTDDDPDLQSIAEIFAKTVKHIFPKCTSLNESFEIWRIKPWEQDDLDEWEYNAWDWKISNDFWPHRNEFSSRDYEFPSRQFTIDTYPSFLETAQAMREDIYHYYHQAPLTKIGTYLSLLQRLKEIDRDKYESVEIYDGGKFDLYDYGSSFGRPISEFIKDIKKRIKLDQEDLPFCEERFEKKNADLEQMIQQIDSLFKHMFVWCLQHHQVEGITFNAAIEEFIAGDYFEALEKIRFLIDISKQRDLENELISKLYLLEGQVQSEFCQYSEAVIALTTAIQTNPSQQEAYFARAAAYFELGDFDHALDDYLASGIHSQPMIHGTPELIPFSVGLTRGIIKGGMEAGLEFFPSLLASMQGLGHGLWVFAQDPVQISSSLVEAAYACIHFVREHSARETLSELLPEVAELIEKWDELDNSRKGEITGHIIGKYGIETFAGVGLVKGMKAYHELKRANHLMTFEAIAISRRNQEVIRAEAARKAHARKAILKTNLKIKLDDQGKHLIGHKNYEPRRNRSIVDHPDLQRLVNKCAGTGIKESPCMPGMAGYKEIVDFGEFIGYDVRPRTGIKTATRWGKIHYAKDGVHVVPFIPREIK